MFRELTESELEMVAKILLDLQIKVNERDELAKNYDDAMSDLALATDNLVNMLTQLNDIKLDNGKYKSMHASEVLETYQNLTAIDVQKDHVRWLSNRFDDALFSLAYYENKLYDMRKYLDDKLKEVQA